MVIFITMRLGLKTLGLHHRHHNCHHVHQRERRSERDHRRTLVSTRLVFEPFGSLSWGPGYGYGQSCHDANYEHNNDDDDDDD